MTTNSTGGADGIPAPLFAVSRLTKRFGPTTVLDNVSFDIPANTVVGLVGENGAGKSTLLNILSGILPPDSGEMWFQGNRFRPKNYKAACQLGVGRSFQEQALIQNVPIYENLLLGHENRFLRAGFLLDRKAMVAAAEKMVRLAEVDVDVRRLTRQCDFSLRQAIEVVRACLLPLSLQQIQHPLVLLDEPTSALAKEHETAIFRVIDRIKRMGTVVFVSHRLTEVLEICDLIYVLKDGELVATVRANETDEAQLHSLMVGRARAIDYYHEYHQVSVEQKPILLEVRSLGSPPTYSDISLTIRAGEILGIGGLLGSGKSALAKGIAGIERPLCGTVKFCGREFRKPEIRELIHLGIAYVPAERMTDGLIGQFPLAWNVSMSSGHDLFSTRWGVWLSKKEKSVASQYISRLRIKSGTPHIPCERLSGGNQQKVVLSRWLCRQPKLFIFDNPTRGVDVGAKEEIYHLIRSLTETGVGVLLVTDELQELIGLSHRIVIMQQGGIVATIDSPVEAKPSEHDVLALMLPSGAPR